MTTAERERLLRRARRIQEIGESIETIAGKDKLKLLISWLNYAEREVRDFRVAVVKTQSREVEREWKKDRR